MIDEKIGAHPDALYHPCRCFSTATNVTCSTEPDGKPMDPTCKWECLPKAKANTFRHNSFCSGRMDMLMLGFDTSGKKRNPCIILFIESWTLDSRTKFFFGCIGVMVLGFCIEALIALRRNVSRRKRFFLDLSNGYRKVILLSTFGLNLVLGYLAMLVAMTYSVELFFCVILGLMIGHYFFNINSAVGESIDPCCSASQNDACNGKGPRIRSSSATPAISTLNGAVEQRETQETLLLTPSKEDVNSCCGHGSGDVDLSVVTVTSATALA